MNATRIARSFGLLALLGLSVTLGLSHANAVQPEPPEAGEGMEVLTRGPVHEAFAGTVTFDPEPGLIVRESPPEAIEELPPDQRPEGTNVAWIPGYWAWDDDRNDFLWVSGIWRALPPGRQWVPGYWARARQGSQWTSGYWADAGVTEVEYLPEPPATVEDGPNVQAPSSDHTWLPGSWVWQENRYLWRPGFWGVTHADWDWIPAHYVWSPRGYVYVDGYYDYAVDRRGVLFAPVYFNPRVYAQRGFTYSPSVTISSTVFGRHLFLRPSYGHYYFGDYYDNRHASQGLSPWFSFQTSRFGYDPLFARERWVHRQNRGWEQSVQRDFQNRRENENARPPRTWANQRARMANAEAAADVNVVVAESLEDRARNRDRRLRIQPLAGTERQQFLERQQAMRQLREQRQKLEDPEADPSLTPSASDFRRTRVRLPVSPIVGTPADRLDKDVSPPSRQEAPQPDANVEPRPRQRRGPGDVPRRADRVTPGQEEPETVEPETPRPERPTSETPRPEAPRPEAPKPETPKPEAPRPETPRPEAPRPEAPRPEAPRPEAPRPEAPKPETPKPEAPRPEAPKPEAPKPEAPNPEAPRPEPPKPEPPRPEAPKPEASKPEPRPRG